MVRLADSLAAALFLHGATRCFGLIECGSILGCTILVHVFHLEDDFESSMENFVESFLFLGRADDEALEGVLLGGCLDFSIADALSKLGSVSLAFELFSQVELGAYEDAGASPCCGLDLSDPLLAGVLKRVALHQTETDDETVCVCVSNRAETTQIFVTSCVPNLKLHFTALVALRSVVRVEHCRLVQRGERLLSPRHDDRGLADGSISDKDQLHVVLLVLIDLHLVCILNDLHHFNWLTLLWVHLCY